ncbi:MAG TPA: hypothetical protein VNN73_21965 [Blastocatellia bacterium]|nr:hypothetical protein [Blastocatellia bacterium]
MSSNSNRGSQAIVLTTHYNHLRLLSFLARPERESFTTEARLGQTISKRLRSPATVRGFIGGESHDSYVIRARKGQIMTVQISWRREHDTDLGGNHAEFFISQSPGLDSGPVDFGKDSNNGKRWSGKIPLTGDYYISVTAHPTAHYTLRVTVR